MWYSHSKFGIATIALAFLAVGCGDSVGKKSGSSTDIPVVEVPFPHPVGFGDPSQHGPYALTSDSRPAPERCDGCHDLEGAGTDGAPGCKSCHTTYPHPAGWGDSNVHVTSLGTTSYNQACATQCHGTDLLGGFSKISCNKCHSDFPHAVNWGQPTQHGLAVFSNSAQRLPSCQSCHGNDLNGGSFAGSCRSCHTFPSASADVRHKPVAGNDCSSCHAKSVAEALEPHLLKKTAPELCAGCHTEGSSSLAYPHSAVQSGTSCLNCHDPHETSRAGLLKNDEKALCLDCHDQTLASAKYGTTRNILAIYDGSSNLHKPFLDGACGDCHAIHGSANNHLLLSNDSMFWISPPSNPLASACLNCHSASTYVTTTSFLKPSPVARPSASLPTQFVRIESSSATNLHALHVVGEGVSCLACHDPHANNDSHLLRSYMTYRDPGSMKFWNFTSCDGCHTNQFPAGYPSGLW